LRCFFYPHFFAYLRGSSRFTKIGGGFAVASNSNFRILGKFSEKNFSPMAIAELYNRVNYFYRHAFFWGGENVDQKAVSGGARFFVNNVVYIYITVWQKIS
jgi:hypothetical protein